MSTAAVATILSEGTRNVPGTDTVAGTSFEGVHGIPASSAVANDAPSSEHGTRTLETIRAIDDFYRRVDELYRQTAARMGLADCDFDILYALAAEDGLTQKQLGERGFSSKQTVHSAVKRMVAKGFVTMRGDSPRTMRAYLTERGRALCDSSIRAVLEGECRAVETFSPAEQRTFVSALSRYADALDANLTALTFR